MSCHTCTHILLHTPGLQPLYSIYANACVTHAHATVTPHTQSPRPPSLPLFTTPPHPSTLINTPPGKDCYVNIEYESSVDYDLQGVIIAIPLPHLGHAPTVNQVRPCGSVCLSDR
jgi:hypothetical protein